MRRESIFAQIERHERFRRKMDERHKKHIESGKRRPNTCFLCRLEFVRAQRQPAAKGASDGKD